MGSKKFIGVKKFKGVVVYEGASLLDGKPTVVIATRDTGNRKTGGMVQTFIMRSDIDPITASRTGEDYSVCGNCIHRGTANPDKKSGGADDRTCYVMLLMLNSVYSAYKRGSYTKVPPRLVPEWFSGELVRLGSYGDPMAIPSWLWDDVLSKAKSHTGYGHQFGVKGADVRPDLCMISVDNEAQARHQWSLGNRTFRVGNSVDDMVQGSEILCPASDEAGKRTTCDKCKLCSGNQIQAKSVFIPVHGNGKNNYRKVA